jgi:hypothetical protein
MVTNLPADGRNVSQSRSNQWILLGGDKSDDGEKPSNSSLLPLSKLKGFYRGKMEVL